MFNARSRSALATISAVLLSAAASAEPVTHAFTGAVVGGDGIWAGQGSTVTGFYTVDDAMVDENPGSGEFDLFRPEINPGLTWEISVTLGSTSRSTASNQRLDSTPHHYLQVNDASGGDIWRIEATKVIGSDDSARLMARDFAPTPPDAIAPGSGSLTGTPTLSPGDLSLYSTLAGESFYEAVDAQGEAEGTVLFTITSVTLASEPAAVPIAPMAQLGAAAGLLALGLAALAIRTRTQH